MFCASSFQISLAAFYSIFVIFLTLVCNANFQTDKDSDKFKIDLYCILHHYDITLRLAKSCLANASVWIVLYCASRFQISSAAFYSMFVIFLTLVCNANFQTDKDSDKFKIDLYFTLL